MLLRFFRPFCQSLVAGLLFACATYFLWPGLDSDEQFSLSRYFGMATYLLFFLLAIFGWGKTLFACCYRNRHTEPLLAMALGSAWVAALVGVALFFHLVGLEFRALFVLFLFCGVIWGERVGKQQEFSGVFPIREWATWILLLVLVLRFLQASILWGASDPLFYHLLAPRLWLEQGGFLFTQNKPLLFHASYWEHLYLALFQPIYWQAGRGLMEFQFLAQWLHCLLGYFGSAFYLRKFARDTFSLDGNWSSLAALGGIFAANFYWTSAIAKNDWGITFWALAGLSLLPLLKREGEFRLVDALISGALLGFAMGGKFTSALFILPVLGASFLYSRSRAHLWVLVTAALISGIAFARNFWFTGNPFFPAFLEVFSPQLTAETTKVLLKNVLIASHRGASESARAFGEFLLLYNGHFFLLLLPLFLGVVRKQFRTRTFALSLATLFSLALYTYCGFAEFRLFGSLLPFGASLAVAALYLGLKELKVRPSLMSLAALLLAGLILLRSDFFVTSNYGMDIVRDEPLYKSVYNLWRAPNARAQIRAFHVAGMSKAWLRQNVKAGERVLLTAENLVYYLPGMEASSVYEDRELDLLSSAANSLQELLPELKRRNVAYILDSYNWYLASQIKMSWLCGEAVKKFPDIVVFRDRDSQVIDIEKLSQHLSSK